MVTLLLLSSSPIEEEEVISRDTDVCRIHAEDENCSSSSNENSTTTPKETLLEGFPWSKRALRLYRLINTQVDDDETIDQYFLIDILKYCVTSDSKFSSTPPTKEKKILQFLKHLKLKGCRIPQAFIIRKNVRSIF